MKTLSPDVVVRSVSEFTNGLAGWFEKQKAFRGAAIRGEISGLEEKTGGHLTFRLRERGASLSCFVYASDVRSLPPLQNGTGAIAVGNVELRGEFSSYQMYVQEVYLTGVGELFAKFNATKEKLRLEGFFETERKRPIPRYVRSVALISAEGSKASQDFLSTIESKVPFVRVVPFWSRVQGNGAEIDVREAFDRADRANVDVIVLTRGGGSYEDLFTFNEEIVVRAIARARHPVITAIGHQTDHHLADDVADATFGTPSKAAEAIAAPWIATRDRLAFLRTGLRRAAEHALARKVQLVEYARSQLENATRRRVDGVERGLASLARRLNLQNPAQRLTERSTRLAALCSRLQPAWQLYINQRGNAVQLAGMRLDAADPNAPLARGYALIFRDGALVRSARDVSPGVSIVARLGHGSLDARVEAVRDE
jgi:exodeoxyribonuclease VII large subunit